MGVVDFQQTDGAAPCGLITWGVPPIVACTGLKSNSPFGQWLAAAIGGTPGTASKQIRFRAGVNAIGLIWQAAPGDVDWLGGTYTVRMNVTGAPGVPYGRWQSTFICRINAACTSVALVGSRINHNRGISNVTPGIYTVNVTNCAAQPGAAATDELYICLYFTHDTGSAWSFYITSDQILNTPLMTKGATRLVDAGPLPRGLTGGILIG